MRDLYRILVEEGVAEQVLNSHQQLQLVEKEPQLARLIQFKGKQSMANSLANTS